MTLDSLFYLKDSLEKIFPDWQVTNELEIIQKNHSLCFVTEQQMGQVRSLGLFPSGISVDPNAIWIQFSIIDNGGGIG